MTNSNLEQTIVISEAITQTLEIINNKLGNNEDVTELVTRVSGLTSQLNKRVERLNKKYVSETKQEATNEEIKTIEEQTSETSIEAEIMNKIPEKYHEYISEVSFAFYYFVKLKDGYVAKNTRKFENEYSNELIDKNLSKIIGNLKTIKTM